MPSFRRRIRRSALVLIILLLATFSALIYTGLSAVLHRHLDGRLLGLGAAWGEFIEDTTGAIPEFSPEVNIGSYRSGATKEDQEFREVARSLVILSPEGTVLWKGIAAQQRPPLPAEAMASVLNGEKVYDTVLVSDGSPVRRLSLPVLRDGKVRYILQIETSLHLTQNTLKQLLVLLALVAVSILGLGWVGTRWLADQALTPVEILSSAAQQMSGSLLTARVSLNAPYEEFQHLAHLFNDMLERLQKVFDAQRRFTADAAHELKTPLTAMKGNLEVTLKKARSAEEYRDVLLANLGQVERLIGLTRPLLTLAQFAGDRPPVTLKPLSIEPLLKELLNELNVLAVDQQIILTLDAHPVPLVLADEAWLRHLVINLLDNALRHTPSGGSITVVLRHLAEQITVAVKDTGPGIAPEHLPHLFERFYRADRSRDRDSGGAGLGLAIVKEIAEAHGGTVQVESDVGTGSTFTVSLPIVKPPPNPS